MKNPIGIMGGMGPMASQLFYKMVTEHTVAEKDQDHINLVLLSDASMPDRTSAILSGQYDGPYNQMLEDARMLEQCGCKAIAITCNTAHFFADMIKDEIGIPIIHMIRETAAWVAGELNVGAGDEEGKADGTSEEKLVGIMATDGTVKTKLYQNAMSEQGLTPFTPPEEVQREVMHQIYDRIKSGLPYDEESWKKIQACYEEAGCKKVLLACTELSVIKADEGLGDWYVDPMEVLARRLIQFAGKEYK